MSKVCTVCHGSFLRAHGSSISSPDKQSSVYEHESTLHWPRKPARDNVYLTKQC